MTTSEIQVEIRPPVTDGERLATVALVRESLEPAWRFGGRTLERTLGEVLLAFVDERLVGAVALAEGVRGGVVNLVVVRSEMRRCGIGSALARSACAELVRRGATEISAAGGGSYLWPGIPRDIPGAVEFFTAMGWETGAEVHDLTRSLADYVTPPQISRRGREAGVDFGGATAAERDWLVTAAGEHWYPGWDQYFAAAALEDVIVGRHGDGGVVAALIIGAPGQAMWEPMLGTGATTIGCVGTVRGSRGTGHRNRTGCRGVGTAARCRRHCVPHRVDRAAQFLWTPRVRAVAHLCDSGASAGRVTEPEPEVAFHDCWT